MRGERTLQLMRSLDEIVLQSGGALYPAKDARMSPALFEASFPRWRNFAALHRPKDVIVVLAPRHWGKMPIAMTMPASASTSQATTMQKVVLLGATSGIALEVERQLARRGCELLLVARSPERLEALQSDLMARGAKQVLTCAADLSSIQQHSGIFDFVRRSFSDYDTVLLAYGAMHDQKDSEASIDILLEELNVNFVSASAILTFFAADLEARRTGCIAAITSVAGDRGRRSNYVYGSAKGALSLFLQGLRSRLHPAGVKVITINRGRCKLR